MTGHKWFKMINMTNKRWFKLIGMILVLMLALVMFGNGTSGAEIRPLHNKGQ
jgi:hypothetical protein